MAWKCLLLLLIIPLTGRAASTPIDRLGLGESVVLTLPGLRRAAISNSNVKLKSIPPNQLLLLGKKEGRAVLTVWFESGRTESREVEVNALPGGDPNRSQGRLIKVLLELIEFDRRKMQELGIQWPAREAFSLSLNGNPFGEVSGSANLQSTRGFIHHYSEKGAVRLLNSPELYVREGEEAIFHSGGEFPVTSSTESYGKTHRHIDWKSFGVKIRIRPKSSDGLHISSDVNVEISELNAGVTVDGVPSVTRRSIQTKIDSIDKETLLLSGLQRTREGDGREAVPFAEKLPILGPLFTFRREERESTELLMAMTLSFSSEGTKGRWDAFRARWPDSGRGSEGTP